MHSRVNRRTVCVGNPDFIVVHLGVRTNAFTRLKTAVGLSFEIARLTRTIAG